MLCHFFVNKLLHLFSFNHFANYDAFSPLRPNPNGGGETCWNNNQRVLWQGIPVETLLWLYQLLVCRAKSHHISVSGGQFCGMHTLQTFWFFFLFFCLRRIHGWNAGKGISSGLDSKCIELFQLSEAKLSMDAWMIGLWSHLPRNTSLLLPY